MREPARITPVATSRPTVLLADDHPLMLDAIAGLLAPDFAVIGAVGDGEALVAEAQRLRPDVIVSDVSMPHMGGLEAARHLRSLVPATRVVFLTVNEDPRLAAEAFRLGALGWVLKTASALELAAAVKAVVRGRRYLSPRIAGGQIHDLPIPSRTGVGVDELTARERQVLSLLARGKAMKEAAAELGITPRTVAFHKYRMMGTLGIRTSAELVRYAVEHGLV